MHAIHCIINYYYKFIEDLSASKRFEIDSEDPYDSTKNPFDEEQSSGSRILQNENRGHKRWREDDSCPDSEFTKAKKPSSLTQSSSNEAISLLSDDHFLVLDPPPPSPLDKGYSERSTGQSSGSNKTLNLYINVYLCRQG